MSALVALYACQEDVESASRTLHDAVTWYSKHLPQSAHLAEIMRATVDFELRTGSPQSAAQLLETLHK